MNFGEALAALKEGKKISRSVWRGYWMILNNADILSPSTHPKERVMINRLIVAVLAHGKGHAPAMPYQEDILADDWLIVE